MHCLICGMELNTCVCPRCSFDQSLCRELYPTLDVDECKLSPLLVHRDSLYRKLEDTAAALTRSQEECRSVSADLEAQKAAIDELSAKQENLQKDFEAASAERENLRQDFEAAQAERETLQQNLEAAQAEQESLRQNYEAAQTERETLQQNLEAASAERETLRQNFEAASAERETLRQNFEAAQAERETLQQNLEAAQAERESLRQDYEAVNDKWNTLREKYETAASERNALRKELRAVNAERDELRKELASVTAECDDLRKNPPDSSVPAKIFPKSPTNVGIWLVQIKRGRCTILGSTIPLSGSVIIPQHLANSLVVAIADSAFEGSDLTTLSVPKTVTRIGKAAFRNCKQLILVSLSYGTAIEAEAFSGCRKLLRVNYPSVADEHSNEDNIDSSAFLGTAPRLVIAAAPGSAPLRFAAGQCYSTSTQTIDNLFVPPSDLL